MTLRTYGTASLWSAVALVLSGGSASAQWVASSNPCGCAQSAQAIQPVQTAQAVQPVVQHCYQTVPVTEYQQVRQMVKKPVVETRYVETPVTTYRPVTETRMAEIPTVAYQDVTECQVMQRDASYYVNRYEPNFKLSPCQYDSRPGLAGWFNRTSYGLRSAFVPDYNIRREYVPNMVTQAVPVTRKVAIQGTRQVAYNVTTMVPEQTTRKVAVNTMRYVDEEVVALQPVTTMKTVQVGTRMALAPLGVGPMTVFGGLPTRTVLAPTPDPVSAKAADPKRSAAASSKYDENAPEEFKRSAEEETPIPAKRTSLERQPGPVMIQPTVRKKSLEPSMAEAKEYSPPSVVRMHRWVARTSVKQNAEPSAAEINVARTEP